mgnify:CR=1 FL=1
MMLKKETNVPYVNLPLQYQQLKEEILPVIKAILERGDYVLGAEVKEFEQRFAAYCQSAYALGVANGTDALILCLKALGVGPGDEVVTVPNSFLATTGAICALGARPRFVDVGDDFNIDPAGIERAITTRTKAILPVHLTGRPAAMFPLLEIARKHSLPVIEDAAQAVGATYHQQKVGSLGLAGCFSFHPLKNLNAAGDAGMITTSNKELYEKIIQLRNHGLRTRDECEQWGYNSRLDTTQAAILNVKLNYLDQWTARIREIARYYQEQLGSVVDLPNEKSYEKSVYHTFIIQTDRRDQLQQYLSSRGIGTKIHYPLPLHLHPAAKGLLYKEGDFPRAEKQAKMILSLPIYPELDDARVQYVVQAIQDFFQGLPREAHS